MSDNERNLGIVATVYGLQFFQLIIIIVGACVRFGKSKHIGTGSRKTIWPKSFNIKLSLECLMLVLIVVNLAVVLIAE
jgi:hypothetical protein